MAFNDHKWSGFPGGYCLDCGVECVEEICMGECPTSPDQGKPEGYKCPNPEHHSGPCLMPVCARCGRQMAQRWDPDLVGTDGKCHRQAARGQIGRSGKRRRATTECLRLPAINWQARGETLQRVIDVLKKPMPPSLSESDKPAWYKNRIDRALAEAEKFL